MPQTFVHAPEKCLVFLDWTSESAAKVIPLIWRVSLAGRYIGGVARQALPVGVIEKVSGVHDPVPQVFEHTAAKLLASSPADNRHFPPHVHAIFSPDSLRDDI